MRCVRRMQGVVHFGVQTFAVERYSRGPPRPLIIEAVLYARLALTLPQPFLRILNED
jgi:hypothetical protein